MRLTPPTRICYTHRFAQHHNHLPDRTWKRRRSCSALVHPASAGQPPRLLISDDCTTSETEMHHRITPHGPTQCNNKRA
uniref:Uncharacterized protein n=1 Tax=Steinernema glaseri TaxID=37863 RepID=A0A1I7ZI73_9BILA